MATLTKTDVASMSLDERLALLDILWESIEEPDVAFAPPDWHREVIEERLAEAERNPGDGVPWEVVKAEMTEKWLR